MRQILSKHKEKGKDREEFETWWTNAGWNLEPLALALKELAGEGTVTEEELKGGDAMAILAYRAGRRAAYLDIYDLLPETAKK